MEPEKDIWAAIYKSSNMYAWTKEWSGFFFGFYNNKAYFKGQDYVLKESKFQNAHGFN